MSLCPKCKGSKFLVSGKVPAELDYIHVKCSGCGTILWVAAVGHYGTHGYCGNPQDHWKDPDKPKSLIELIKEQARKPVEVNNEIPF